MYILEQSIQTFVNNNKRRENEKILIRILMTLLIYQLNINRDNNLLFTLFMFALMKRHWKVSCKWVSVVIRNIQNVALA